MISRYGLGPSHKVVEIGSNDGYLLRYFQEQGIPVTGVEPAANVAQAALAAGIPTLVKFLGAHTAREIAAQGIQADLLVGNNVLAHVPDLNDFVKGLEILLKPRGVLTMEFPHLLKLMKENQFDTIYHEHFSYFSLATVKQVLLKHGLLVFDVRELPTHGGSLRIYAGHAEANNQVSDRVGGLLRTEKDEGLAHLETYGAFGEKIRETKRILLAYLIQAKDRGNKIAAYGAAAKGNTLLNYCGIRNDFIEYVVDRNPYKQGRFLPGTHIPVYAPEKIMETRPDYLLILPWNLKEEIVRQMSFIREWGGKFLIPIPKLEVL
jgi:SAM-dependent methyltransferase